MGSFLKECHHLLSLEKWACGEISTKQIKIWRRLHIWNLLFQTFPMIYNMMAILHILEVPKWVMMWHIWGLLEYA